MKCGFAAVLLAAALVVGCDAPPKVGKIGNGTSIPNTSNNGGGQVGKALKFEFHKVQDPGSNNMVAYTYVMPTGWIAEDSIQWTTFGKLPYPVSQLSVHTPDRSYGMAVYPMMIGSWSSGPGGQTGIAYNNASEAIKAIMSRAKGITNFQVIDEASQPVQSGYGQVEGSQSSADVCTMHFQCTQDGIDKEGFIVAKLDSSRSQDPYTQAQLWNLGLQIFAAPAGKLTNNPEFIKVASVFLKSASITPEYNELVNKVSFDASQTARKAAQEQEEQIMKQYWDRQKSQDRMAENFDQYIRGTNNYEPPGGGSPIALPNAGKYWMNGSGQIVTSDDPNYDPNNDPDGGGGGWQQMNPANG